MQYVSTFYVQVDVAGIALGFLSLLYTGRYVHIVSLKTYQAPQGIINCSALLLTGYFSYDARVGGLRLYHPYARCPDAPGARHAAQACVSIR